MFDILFCRGIPSCQRCRQIGIACEGYGLRLSWIQYNPHDSEDCDFESTHQVQPRASRRNLPSIGNLPSFSYLPTQRLDSILNTIDGWSPGESSGLEVGAFCVFAANSISSPQFNANTDNFQSYSYSPETTVTVDAPAADCYAYPVGDSPQDERDATPDAIARSRGDFRTNTQSIAGDREGLRQYGREAPPRHLDALSMPSNQKRLIHHWVTFTSRKLVLIDEPQNPCRTMMLPMALKGLVSQSTGSTADVAIFHAICASAAYNLFELTSRTNEQDRVLALYHDNEAVHHLRHNLNQASEHRNQSCAMAIMACIAVEAVSGTTQRWRTHVSGGLAYLATLQSQGVDEIALSVFRQHMVKMAILCGFPVSNHLKLFLDDESGASDGLEFTFPYYGVSRSFLRAHDRINTLLAKPPGSKTHEWEMELDAFELQLYLDFPGLPPHDLMTSTKNRMHGIVIHHTSKAFYYAGLVFFQRSVRSAPLAEVQDLVELGIRELESIDRLGQGKLGCLMLWPVLVLGAESSTPDVRKRMSAWFHGQRSLGFRNLIVLEDIVTAVWKARSDSCSGVRDADWRQIIAVAEFDVFRL
jgi:hypothetical protein